MKTVARALQLRLPPAGLRRPSRRTALRCSGLLFERPPQQQCSLDLGPALGAFLEVLEQVRYDTLVVDLAGCVTMQQRVVRM
jgi:hypothetical protein